METVRPEKRCGPRAQWRAAPHRESCNDQADGAEQQPDQQVLLLLSILGLRACGGHGLTR
jgi:hypothetical protein